MNGLQQQLHNYLYPSRHYSDKGDEYFIRLWKSIDESREYCWIMTYAMDSSMTANMTLLKLINARKRGVNVVLFVDDLQKYTNKELVQKLINNGGVYVSLNPTWRQFWNILNQEFFRRHHEKLVVIDDKTIIGSANIESVYGGPKYGSSTFYDFNLFTSGYVNTHNFKQHFVKVANLYNIKLNPQSTQLNEETIIDHPTLPPYFKFLYSHQPNQREIQTHVLESIQQAKESIMMVHPYYYPVRIFEQELKNALDRGVQVQLITSAKRDQPVYHYIKNYMLFRDLFHKNLRLYEYPEQLLHMKGYLIDGTKFNIGSFNNDRWSWKLNNEVNIVTDNQGEADRLRGMMDNCKEYSREVFPQGSVTMWRYTKIKFWELFIYLSEVLMSKNKCQHISKYKYKNIYAAWDDSLGTHF